MSEKCFWCEGRETLVLSARGDTPERSVKCVCPILAEIRRLREALESARSAILIVRNQAFEAAKTHPRWQGVSGRLMSELRMIDAALTPPAAEAGKESTNA